MSYEFSTLENDTQSELKMAMLAMKQGQLDQAEKLTRHVLKHRSDWPDALQLLALIRRRLADVAEAKALFERCLNIQPDNPNYHHNLGNLLRAMGQPVDAARAYQKALNINPNLATTQLNLIRSINEYKDFDRTLEVIEFLPTDVQNQPSILLEKGRATFGIRRLDEARSIFLEVRKHFSENIQLLLDIGLVSFLTGDLDEATTAFEECAGSGVSVDLCFFLLGRIELQKGNFSTAMKWFSKAANEAPFDPNFQIAYADFLYQQGSQSSLAFFQAAAISHPGNLNLKLAFGWAKFLEKGPVEGLKWLKDKAEFLVEEENDNVNGDGFEVFEHQGRMDIIREFVAPASSAICSASTYFGAFTKKNGTAVAGYQSFIMSTILQSLHLGDVDFAYAQAAKLEQVSNWTADSYFAWGVAALHRGAFEILCNRLEQAGPNYWKDTRLVTLYLEGLSRIKDEKTVHWADPALVVASYEFDLSALCPNWQATRVNLENDCANWYDFFAKPSLFAPSDDVLFTDVSHILGSFRQSLRSAIAQKLEIYLSQFEKTQGHPLLMFYQAQRWFLNLISTFSLDVDEHIDSHCNPVGWLTGIVWIDENEDAQDGDVTRADSADDEMGARPMLEFGRTQPPFPCNDMAEQEVIEMKKNHLYFIPAYCWRALKIQNAGERGQEKKTGQKNGFRFLQFDIRDGR